MSISGAFANAITGLRAAGRGAEVVSSNIANSLTPGYAKRVLELSSSNIGGSGVRIDGILRINDQGLLSDLRLARAEQGNTQPQADFFAKLENLFGTPDAPHSIAARLSEFESSLVTAASRPDAPERLDAAVANAQLLIDRIGAASAGIQESRQQADATISFEVDRLNQSLQQIKALNSQITRVQAQSGDTAGLLDRRQNLTDEIAAIVPVREAARDNGQIALYTTGGVLLIDGTAATLEFTRSNVITPYMSVGAGTLSGLTINGNAVATDSIRGVLRGGTIGAAFAIRDEIAPDAQSQLDALARDLVERFQDPSVDPTLAATDPGLFADQAAFFDSIDEVGLSSRLTLNAQVDPGQGGESWRLRAGINAAIPGDQGDASQLHALSGAISGSRTPASGGFGNGALSASDLISTLSSSFASQRINADRSVTFASARVTELTERHLADGVDTDEELRNLLRVEQAYAANARMVEVLNELTDTLLRI